MLFRILILMLVTLLPFLELRASIPLGILSGSVDLPFGIVLQGFAMNWLLVFLICVITNIILGPIVFVLLNRFFNYFLKFKSFNKFYSRKVEKTQKEIRPLVRKYGLFGLALFIAIPLPGSGSYTGAIAAHILGMRYRRFIIANSIGVVIAGAIVTLVSLGVINFF